MFANFLNPGSDLFFRAAASLVDAISGVTLDAKPTPISKFKASYGEVLDNVNHGRVQVIQQGRRRYVLLSEDQVIALAQQNKKTRSLGDIIRSVEQPPRPLDSGSSYLKRPKASQFKLPRHAGK
ncbi:type II toxin-antitoxin system Phd/YefM family antitoxin [Pelomonas sp. CA6]|uniref:type II toxin-antitoxin system Phd/YefM family antitoxin n=1 Tax=Pelomonas sp. CA6 TaxID=2907999 RepID=UPI001F4BD5F7|nr:type II toxin-antitoxin system Phd/YefM family antitoxin [Pelomonas sp. CA6]MCH7344334.1 type II toxin-antitoxin system Phd/YefM family antitoxin [Pelomonas sp. CA6]